MGKIKKVLMMFSFILVILGLFSICYAEGTDEETPKRADISNIAFEWAGYDETSHT